MPAALQLVRVTKSYPAGFLHLKRREALRALSLSVETGETLGILGPNGAGKTTTFSLVFGFSRPDSGSVTVLGSAPQELAWKARAGYLPEQPFVHDFLTPKELLENTGRLLGLPSSESRRRAGFWLDRVDLASSAKTRSGRLSKGMRQRLALSLAFFGDPDFIVLDEPMSGLDPPGRALVRGLIQEFRGRERTIIFSTHILQDAEALCDRVALLSGGCLLAEGSLDDILGTRADFLEITMEGPPGVMGQIPKATPVPGSRHYKTIVPASALGRSVEEIQSRGCGIVGIHPRPESLDELFARRIGKPSAPFPEAS